MATLDQDDLDAIRGIVQDELQNDANANSYVERLDETISLVAGNVWSVATRELTTQTGLSADEHNHLMGLVNTDIADTNTNLKTAIALSAKRRK